MGLGVISTLMNGVVKPLLVAFDVNGNFAAASMPVGSDGQEKGTSANPHIVASVGATQIITGQVDVGVTSTLIVAARPGRKSVMIVQEGNIVVRLGPTSVAANTGIPLADTKYASVTVGGAAAVYGIASATQRVSYMEEF